jgi:hypothetical protein
MISERSAANGFGMGDLRLGTGGDRASLARAAAFSYLRPQVSTALGPLCGVALQKAEYLGHHEPPMEKRVAFPVTLG